MSEQAEEMLLGSVLKDNSILNDLTVSPEHFLDAINRQVYQSMLNIKKKGFPIDAASLKDDLGDTGFMFIGGSEILITYKNCVPSVHTFRSYEQMVINQWKISTTRETLRSAIDSVLSVDSVQTLIKDLSKIDEEGTQDEFDLRAHLKELADLPYTKVEEGRSGIPSGFEDIDNKTDGFQENDLVIVGARPSMGKTAFMLNMAKNAGTKGKAIPIIFSLEMSSKSLIKRMISCIGEINGMNLKNPYQYLNDEEKDKWVKALGVVDELELKIYDRPRQKVSEMRAKVRKIKHDNPDREAIVLIDYLTLIKPSKDYGGNAHQQISEITADLKAMAKELQCPVICLAQLSRGVESRADKRPLMSDLRESGSIEQDADVIMLLYRDEYYNETNEENRNLLEVDVAKNREGEVGKVYIRYLKDINRMENLYHYHAQRK